MKRMCLTGVALMVSAALWAAGPFVEPFCGTVILGRPTDTSVTASVLSSKALDAYVEWGPAKTEFGRKSAVASLQAGSPAEFLLDHLQSDTSYAYRVRYRQPGAGAFTAGSQAEFTTARGPGASFTFALQGDSHPEREKNMYSPDLYMRTMENVAAAKPDFYVLMGDDFSIDPLINRGGVTQQAVDVVYANQRRFLGAVGRSAPLFLVNGNHEEAASYLLDGTRTSPAVLAGLSRNRFFALPAPDAFYTGDADPVEFVGLRRDYYAWTWGDALFVVIDFYWHSPVVVDAPAGGGGGGQGGRRAGGGQAGARGGGAGRAAGSTDRGQGAGRARDQWQVTLGDAQYQWLRKTLEQSKARYKFVFAHHVLGTGRGAVELADFFEWGGKNRNGQWEFDKRRPDWPLPIHQLMVKTGVTAFFQGHDHLFAHQEKDGVVYQETPNPADNSYTIFNKDAYRSGDILSNSGFLRVMVSPAQVKVDYVRSFLPNDETKDRKNGDVAFSYTLQSRMVTKQ